MSDKIFLEIVSYREDGKAEFCKKNECGEVE